MRISAKSFWPAICLLFLFVLPAAAQSPSSYEQEWKRVTKLAKKGLPRSAYDEAKKIYDQAKTANQDIQAIKALIYMIAMRQQFEDEAPLISIRTLKKELHGSTGIATAILQSLLAEAYWKYYDNNRWQMYNRSNGPKVNPEDMTTWSGEDFFKVVARLYDSSLHNKQLLQQTSLAAIDPILVEGNTRKLRPVLYDLLANRAFDYFRNEELSIRNPKQVFYLQQPEAFADAASFIQYRFDTPDSTSHQYKALLICQDLLAFHLNDPDPSALIEADIRRISFSRVKSIHPDREALYLKALDHIVQQYAGHPAASNALYHQALYYENKGNGYRAYIDSTHRLSLLKAKALCEKALEIKEESEGRINCESLLDRLKKPYISFTIEKNTVPGQPFRAFVEYERVPVAHMRLIRHDEALKEKLAKPKALYLPTLLEAPVFRGWEQQLPGTEDLQFHTAEVKIDAIPSGDYILIIGTGKDFKNTNTLIAYRFFTATNISYISENRDYFVLDRETGQPLPGATVQFEYRIFNSTTKEIEKHKGPIQISDINGQIRVPEIVRDVIGTGRNSGFGVEIKYKDEIFFNYTGGYSKVAFRDPAPVDTKTDIFLFTDRSIYRPGQEVYFKGIAIRNDSRARGTVHAGLPVNLDFINANYAVIDSVKLITNEFGSFSGVFRIPASTRTGNFRIEVADGFDMEIIFKVEEYKRPGFTITYDTVKKDYLLGDSVQSTGVATAYAGNPIDNATVEYTIYRTLKNARPLPYYKRERTSVYKSRFASGTTSTDANGRFIINFEATPEQEIVKIKDPIFEYSISVSITDNKGETRSAASNIQVGYRSININTNIGENATLDELQSLFIRTENLAGVFQPGIITVTTERLQPEQRLIRERLWNRPDQFTMNKEEYLRYFPHDEYDNETAFENWKVDSIVSQRTDSVKSDGNWKFDRLPGEGVYCITITTKDKKGTMITERRYVRVFDKSESRLINPEYLRVQGNIKLSPGESKPMTVSSSVENVFLIRQYEKEQYKPSYSFFNLSNTKKEFACKATEAERGGYGLKWVFVKHNRVYHSTQRVEVPWTNKELTVEFTSFRDKTLPGSAETWKLHISGSQKEKVAAEMLGVLYDESLDQLYPHNISKPLIWRNYYPGSSHSDTWRMSDCFDKAICYIRSRRASSPKKFDKQYDELLGVRLLSYRGGGGDDMLWWLDETNTGFKYSYGKRGEELERRVLRSSLPRTNSGSDLDMDDLAPFRGSNFQTTFQHDMNPDVMYLYSNSSIEYVAKRKDARGEEMLYEEPVNVRRNFRETAFFLPSLQTDKDGNINISFTIPESVTSWKFIGMAHTKDGAFGRITQKVVTQKQLMVQSYQPRFLREGDTVLLSANIANQSGKDITGVANLQLTDAATNEPLNKLFNAVPQQSFTIPAGQSMAVQFPVVIPASFTQPLNCKIIAKAGEHSDGEEITIPVLTNRALVTETVPLPMNSAGVKEFRFDKLLQSGNMPGLQNHSLTVEYTSNPVWYAVQSLPYLVNYPYECAEQTWNRYFASALSSHIASSSPRIAGVYQQWKTLDTAALQSQLEKNPELKNILLEETPWVLAAKNEQQQKRNIALLFDMLHMNEQRSKVFRRLDDLQKADGSFAWFAGGNGDLYITQYILTGIGHLQKIKRRDAPVNKGIPFATFESDGLERIAGKAIKYIDHEMSEYYRELRRAKEDNDYTPGAGDILYLYMRSFFPDVSFPGGSNTTYHFFLERAKKTWTRQSKYLQGMIAMALHRKDNTATAKQILASLKETAVMNEEMGMYWKENAGGYYWQNARIETQCLLIEAFDEIAHDTITVNALRTWLLKNKQTNHWGTTRATAEACYALLATGSKWISQETEVTIQLGNSTIRSTDNKQEAGIGYFKTSFAPEAIKPAMGNISVAVSSPTSSATTSPSWGSVYWQYFQDLDKITPAASPLQLTKQLFIKKNNANGEVLLPINSTNVLHVGDKLVVRIELRADRNLEYVHMKDMRASGLEPVNVLSRYKWQDGLGYYEMTKDAATHFFFDRLPKGVYVFEYPLYVTHAGNFSNGISTIQCMYAPEFSAHSEGVRIAVESEDRGRKSKD